MSGRLDDWKNGDGFRTEHLNQPVRAIRDLQRRAGGGEGHAQGQMGLRPMLAYTTTAGPNGEDDFTDSRYWCVFAGVSGSSTENTLPAFASTHARRRSAAWDPETGDIPPDIVQAVNLGEWLPRQEGQTQHGIRPSTPVLLFPTYRVNVGFDSAQLLYVFSGPNRDVQLVKVTGSGGGGGKYTGYLLKSPNVDTDIPSTGDLTEAELWGTSNPEEIRIVNTREVGKATHDLEDAGFLPLIFVGVYIKTAEDGLAVYAIDGQQHKDCES